MSEEEKKESYYSRNRERQLELAKKYRAEHAEQYKTYWVTYYQKNKDELKVKHRNYVRNNREKINQKQRTIYYKRHQAKKKGETPEPLPSVLSPTVEMPMWAMKVSTGNHLVSFE